MKYSSIQTANFIALVPVIAIVLAQFNIIATPEDITTTVTAVIALGGILTSMWRRYLQGDINLIGKRLPKGEKGV